MTVFFTSDLHLGHESVWARRSFDEEFMFINFEACLTKRDQLWILGDISNGSTGAQRSALADMKAMRDATGAEFHLIPGNHDGCHPQHRTAKKWWSEYLEVFDTIMPFANRKIAGKHVCLSHYPYTGEHGELLEEDRHPQWRLKDTGRWLLHGHTHQSHPLSVGTFYGGGLVCRGAESTEQWLNSYGPRIRQINVGVDAWGFWPVSLDVIARIIDGAEEGTLVPEDDEWIGA